MSATELVPSNHRHLERALAAALEPLGAIDPGAMETLWNAWRCPSAFLPFLAYALSVDLWDDAWDENLKRQAIADSPEYHRLKGTRRAVEMAVATLGRAAELVEWHEVSPPRRRGTFEIRVPIIPGEDLAPLTEQLAHMRRLVMAAKPKARSFAVSLTVTTETGLTPSVGLNTIERVELYAPADEIEIVIGLSAGVMSGETVTLGEF
jgi:phage tail P2-like protein